jgi:hypothetical protein
MNEPSYGLPKRFDFCRHCVVNNQLPSSTVEFEHKKDEVKA